MRDAPRSVEELEDRLSTPNARVINTLAGLPGDLIFLGVGGKMGPTMARMALRATQEAGLNRRVFGVSRFSDPTARKRLESSGVETIAGDLLDESFVESLPEAALVVHMAGFKFGTSRDSAMTWAMNCYLPALVCRKFASSRVVAFSTGNVYGLVPTTESGSLETDTPNPVGEYAMAALGRERMFQYFSQQLKIPIAILRLNYATEMRYGVLVDLAQQVAASEAVDISMSYVNVIWQADASAMALAALAEASTPARVINIAGPEKLSVRDVALQFGQLMQQPVQFAGAESGDALLNDGRHGYESLGSPQVDAETLVRWTADWISRGGETLGKPTKFQNRKGNF